MTNRNDSDTNSYDTLNRLTQMGSSMNASPISNYAYTLGLAGNRLTVAELSGGRVAYGYDSLYRLTTETVTSDPHNNDGAISYTYDAVGNRKTLNSTLPPEGGMVYTYDADDHLGSDQYDADGNTVNSFGIANAYDFENRMITHGGVTIVYDGDGNRVAETVGGVTTNYLVDTVNPTGYAQVVDELQSSTVARTYSYGLERISENQTLNSTWTPSFYGYDGHGSVRQLTSAAGAVTDSYDYDAFGNLVNQTGSTPNNYLFAGEQYDPALSLYYNRARYLNTATGRFWNMDTQQGRDRDPLSLHKYLYAEGDPIDHADPSGNQIDDLAGFALDATLSAISTIGLPSGPGGPAAQILLNALIPQSVWDILNHANPNAVGFGVSAVGNGSLGGLQLSGGFGLDYVFSGRTGNSALYLSSGVFEAAGARGAGISGWAGAIYNLPSASFFAGPFISVAFPASDLPQNLLTSLLAGASSGYFAATAATNSGNSALAAALAFTGAFANLVNPGLLTADVFFSPYPPYTVGLTAMFGGPTNTVPNWQLGVTADILLTGDVLF